MPYFDSLCEQCNHEEPLYLKTGGDHPPCTRCGGPTIYLWRGKPAQIQTDESFIGGIAIENLGHEPITVYSRQDLARKMKAAHVEQRIKWAGDGDKFLTNWAAGIDPQTLENAKFLLEHRTGGAKSPDPTQLQTLQTSIRVLPAERIV